MQRILINQAVACRNAKAIYLIAAIVLVFAPGTSFAQCTTSTPCVSAPTNLGTLPGGTQSFAFGTNGDGSVVVGFSNIITPTTTGVHAVRWTSAGIQDLGTLGGRDSQANGVSGDGSVVVGWSLISPVASTSAGPRRLGCRISVPLGVKIPRLSA